MIVKFAVLVLACSGAFAFPLEEDLKIISRSEWGARIPKTDPGPLEEPVPFVVIHHSATPRCSTKTKCLRAVKAFQNYHMDHNGWSDIGYNFVIGEDGNIYEGRGWGATGTHARSYNKRSIGICIIGNFTDELPNEIALDKVQELIDYGVENNKIEFHHKIIGHRQAAATECPGQKLFNEMQKWPQFTSKPEKP